MTDSIGSSMRFYAESLYSARFHASLRARVHVPVGLADFPKEASRTPLSVARLRFSNVVRYTEMPRGGHFAAMEAPELLASDLNAFVDTVMAPQA